MAFDFCVDVLALSAQCEQLYQIDMVHQRTCGIKPVLLGPHQLQQRLERVPIIVEHKNFFTNVDQLNTNAIMQMYIRSKINKKMKLNKMNGLLDC